MSWWVRCGHLALAAVVSCSAAGDGPGGEGGRVGNSVYAECIPECDPALCVVDGDGEPVLSDDGIPVNACVNNECRLRCDSHTDCIVPNEICAPAIEDDTGAEILVCEATAIPGGVLNPCPHGDVGDHDDECPEGLLCVPKRKGDADAYCAQPDCITDDDCSPGFYCGVIRDPRRISGTDKGNNVFCGTTSEDDVDPADLSEDGPLFEGPLCIMRRVCLVRSECTPCETSLDCSYSGTRCVDVGGEKRCLAGCDRPGDCALDKECNDGLCVPRFGRCTGDGETFCEPCVDDLDCGDASNQWACEEVQIGQWACLDYGFVCSSNDECLGDRRCWWPEGDQGLDPICHPPVDPDTQFFTCY